MSGSRLIYLFSIYYTYKYLISTYITIYITYTYRLMKYNGKKEKIYVVKLKLNTWIADDYNYL